MGIKYNDDRFERDWDYRVFSQPHTNPDDWNIGHRYLSVHLVDYARHRWGKRERPIPGDLEFIHAEPASPGGIGMEEYILDLERIAKAHDKPTLIKAEFQDLFDHSEKCNRENDARRVARKTKT